MKRAAKKVARKSAAPDSIARIAAHCAARFPTDNVADTFGSWLNGVRTNWPSTDEGEIERFGKALWDQIAGKVVPKYPDGDDEFDIINLRLCEIETLADLLAPNGDEGDLDARAGYLIRRLAGEAQEALDEGLKKVDAEIEALKAKRETA